MGSSQGRHAAGAPEDSAGSEGGDERFVHGTGSKADRSVLAQDVAHPFDQTNGIIDGLEGDADDPDRVQSRLGGDNSYERAFADDKGDDFERNEELGEDEAP